MSVANRYRFAAKLIRCLAAGGFISVAACAPPAEDIGDQATPEVQIERDIQRLRALDILDFDELVYSQPDATGSPYTLTLEERADRLTAFTDIAEFAAADVDASHISDQFQTEAGEPNLCVGVTGGDFCLTTSMHEDNLQRVNQLQVIEVSDIIRSEEQTTGACYSSWDTVTEADCVRALQLDAIIDGAEGALD